jgi:ABC-2 type transport system ATP-binding protein
MRGLSKALRNLVAVDEISFAVGPGEVLGFLGPNGAGKSTTMKMIAGFLSPDGRPCLGLRPRRGSGTGGSQARMGYLPEGAPCYGEMTPRAFLGFVAEFRGLSGDQRRRRRRGHRAPAAGRVLEQPIETLSKGFKRRVGLAQAILHDPEVLSSTSRPTASTRTRSTRSAA